MPAKTAPDAGDSASDPASTLYRERPEDFVAARNRLVRELRGRGERERAAEVASMRRPTLSVWAANRLHEEAPAELRELLSTGGELQAAQARAATGDAVARSEFRKQLARQAELIDDLVRVSVGVLQREGYGASEDIVRRLSATLRAAATDPDEQSQRLAAGQLAADLEPAGFGALAAAAPARAAESPPVARPEGALEAAKRAEEARREARRDADEKERAAVAARARADELARRARRLVEEARVAGEEATAAEAEAREAEEQAAEARRRIP